jgi:phosphoglucosamine mutase
MLAHALVSGISSSGAQAELLGVLPTPGIAFMTRATGANGGIVISASHNPYQDNGIKIFSAEGCKLPDETEAEIERIVLSEKSSDTGSRLHETGRIIGVADAAGRYSDFLKTCRSGPFANIHVVLDCANGATYQVAPRVVFRIWRRRGNDQRSPGREEHQRELRIRSIEALPAGGASGGLASAWPSTATATG